MDGNNLEEKADTLIIQEIRIKEGISNTRNIVNSHNPVPNLNSVVAKDFKESERKITDESLLSKLISTGHNSNVDLVLERYPGRLFMFFYSIEQISPHPTDLISLTVQIDGKSYSSNKFPLKTFVKPDLHVNLPITKRIDTPIKIKVSLGTYKMNDSFNSLNSPLYSVLEIDNDKLISLQNNLSEDKLSMKPESGFLSLAYRRVFQAKEEASPICRCYFSYMADDDSKMFNAHPSSILSISKWVLFRRVAFDLMLEGFMNIKCERYAYTWQRKYIKWYGFMIFILDAETKAFEESIDLSHAQSSIEILLRKIIRFNIRDKLFEIECLDISSFKQCTEALYSLFLRIMNIM